MSNQDDKTVEVIDGGSTSQLPVVAVVVGVVEGAELGPAISAITRQTYGGVGGITIVGDIGKSDIESSAEINVVATLESAIVKTSGEAEFLWLLHSDARPRPDALEALVSEVVRSEASLGGSKLLVAGTDQLQSIGSATDVFGEAYSGLDEGEIDLQQYDVVREVAFVSSVSMLVRRDLAQGLRGLDGLLEPGAAGLDFSQRVRLAGGKVITVPSSEVFHQSRCESPSGWREQAGRLRAMLKAYSPVTLAWMIPVDFLVSVLDSIANALVLRWRPIAGHVMSWLWNLVHLPSTLAERRRFAPVRAFGDVELFRFQSGGSVRMRRLGSQVANRILSIFDDDQMLAKSARRIWSSPGIWGALFASLVVAFGARTILLAGMADSGFSFPFEDGLRSLERFLGGWNDVGLGSDAAPHPSALITALTSLILFGSETAARLVLTLGAGVAAVVGMGRLSGRLGLRGPGRYLAGWLVLGGAGMAVLIGRGSWLALMAASILPWAIRAVLRRPSSAAKATLRRYAWPIGLTLVLTAFSPLLGLAPFLFAVLLKLVGGTQVDFRPAISSLASLTVATPFLIGDPGWTAFDTRRLGLEVPPIWTFLLAGTAIAAAWLLRGFLSRLALIGGLVGLVGLVVGQVAVGGPGLEEAAFVASGFGSALLVAAAIDSWPSDIRTAVVSIGGLALLVLSLGSLMNGKMGLPDGSWNDDLAFAGVLAADSDPARLLLASADLAQLPGEARRGPGFFYRLFDGSGMTQSDVWLAPERTGDDALDRELALLVSGAELRPGSVLADFGVGWVVSTGSPSVLDDALLRQLDLRPLPLTTDSRTYENLVAGFVAFDGEEPWTQKGSDFVGRGGNRTVSIAINDLEGWDSMSDLDEWNVEVETASGVVSYHSHWSDQVLPILAVAIFFACIGAIIWERQAG